MSAPKETETLAEPLEPEPTPDSKQPLQKEKEDKKEAEKEDEKKEEKEKIEARGGLSRLLKEHGDGVTLYGWLGAIGGILNGATTPAFFVLFGDLIDMGSNSLMVPDLKQEALDLMWKFFIIGFGFFVFNTFQYVCFGYYGAKVSVAVRKAYFQCLLQQEVGYYDEKNSGALNTAMISDCLNIAGMGTAMGLMCQHLITFIAGFVLAFYYSWQLSLVLLAVSPLFVIVGIISAWFEAQGTAGGLRGDDTKKDKKDPVADAGSFSNEVLISIRSVKAIPMLLDSKLREYQSKLEDIIPMAKKQGIGMGLSFGGMFFIFLGVMYSLGYWYGGKLVDEGTIEIGDMYLCMFALPIGAMSLGSLGSANADLVKARDAANKFFALKDRTPEIKAADTEKEKVVRKDEDRLTGDISFNNVSFAYPTAPETIVLDKVSFEVASGKTLALVGPSGSGKSTVINLLERYYDPQHGEVVVDNEKIHNYDIEYLRKNIGYVSQTPLLFAESIRENIRGGNPNISDEDVIDAAKTADAHDFILQLKDGYDTNVGEMGNRLSGGQKQRIAIARAMVSNPSILLFDEATSALDTKSEREVQRAIDKISSTHSKTIIVIAHRLSTIKNADQILVIVDGEIEEKGDHESLIESDGVYAALVREQQVIVPEVMPDNIEDNPPQYEANNDEETGRAETGAESKEPEDKGRTDAVAIDVKDDADTKADTKEDKKEEEEKEEVPDMGGTKRVNKEYASQFQCLFTGAVVAAFFNGLLWPVAYGWFFPEIIAILSDEIRCEADALSLADCHTEFEEAALKLVIWWVILGTYGLIVQMIQTYLFGIYGARIGNAVKYDWFEAVIRQDITYHDVETSAKLNACLTAETQSISDGMGWKYGLVMQSISQIIAGFGISFYRSWRVSLVFLGLTPLLIISGVLGTMAYMDMGKENADPFLEAGTISQEILTNIRTVLAFPYLIVVKTSAFVEKVHIGLPVATKRAAVSGFTTGINLFISQGIIYGVGMYAGLRFVDEGWVTFDDVMGAFFGVLMGGMALGQMGSAFPSFQTANIAANKFFVAKERVAERKQPDHDVVSTDTRIAGSIEFKNVSFAYHSAPDTQVLNNVSFRVAAGETLAIVGPSGSGKSTIISLIERFYDCNSGDIVIDDRDGIHNYDLSHLRSSIGLVSQMPLLFDTSIADNIRAGNMDATDEDIVDAAKQANAHGFIEKFTAKYETNVGELGGKLSGGQRQRIAIARALLNKPAILLLDEATSALDSKSEKEVQQAIDNITQNGNKTVISIAHRLSTIKNSNTIIVLVDGQVRESGNHGELMASRGVYAALVDAQALVEQKKEIHKRRSHIIDRDELPIEEVAS